MERRLAAILLADIVGYSRLIGLDEERTIARQNAHRAEIIDPLVETHSGRIANTAGDSLLIEFPSAVEAVRCALAVQQSVAEREAGLPEDQRLAYRVGINVGDVVAQDDDLLGDGVNIAGRLEGLAPPGGVVISRSVRDSVRDRLDLDLADLGEVKVKNIERPVRAFQVLREGEAPMVLLEAPQRGWWVFAAAAAILALMIAGGTWWWMQRPDFEPADPAKMEYALAQPSIAVLAFDNMTGNPKQDHVGDGISEDIISALARVPGVVVIARNSSFSYKGKPIDVRQIAEELSVRYVLEGSLQEFDQSIRVSAQLVDAISGRHVWSKSFDRPQEKFFKLRDDITWDIIGELNRQLVVGDGRRFRPDNFRTMEAWLISRKVIWHYRRYNSTDNQIAIDLAHRILEIEPDSVDAYARIALGHAWNGRARWTNDREESFRLAEFNAKKTITLNNRVPRGYAALGWVRMAQSQVKEAIALQEKALELAPGDAFEMAALALFLQKDMQADRSAELFARSIRMNRKAPGWVWENYGETLVIAGRHKEAIPIYRAALEHGAKGVVAGEVHLGLAICYDALGRDDDARKEIKTAVFAVPKFSVAFLRDFQTYTDQAYKERWLATLKRLGLPPK